MHKASIAAGRRQRTSGCSGPGRRCCAADRPWSPCARSARAAGRARPAGASASCCSTPACGVALVRHPMPYGDLERMRVQRFASLDDIDAAESDGGGAGGVRAARARWAWSCTPASTTPRSSAGPSRRPTSSSGTAATTTSRSTCPTCMSPSSTRSAPATSCATTRRDEPADGGRRRRQQGGQRRAGRRRPVRRHVDAVNPAAHGRPGRLAGRPGARARRWPARACSSSRTGRRITHGGMPFGAGTVAARQAGAAELVDPRPYAVGSIADDASRATRTSGGAARHGLRPRPARRARRHDPRGDRATPWSSARRSTSAG